MPETPKVQVQVEGNYVMDALRSALAETREQHLMLTALVNQQQDEKTRLLARIAELEATDAPTSD